MQKKNPQPQDLEAAQTPPATETPSAEEQFKKLEAEKKALFDQLVRRQADFENFRKRTEREQQELRQYAEADLVTALLPVLDAFERALAAPANSQEAEYRKGVELICKQLFDVLTRAGLKPVEAIGRTFDPFHHHAVERVETTEHGDQEVLAELQRGYTFKDRLLRPALVRVAVSPVSPDAGAAETPEFED